MGTGQPNVNATSLKSLIVGPNRFPDFTWWGGKPVPHQVGSYGNNWLQAVPVLSPSQGAPAPKRSRPSPETAAGAKAL